MNEKNLPSVRFGDETISLKMDGTWEPSDDSVRVFARAADVLSRPPLYEYSPSHGSYGFRLSRIVASKLGGELELPTQRDGSDLAPDDVVF